MSTELNQGTGIGRQRSVKPATLNFLQQRPGLPTHSSMAGVLGQVVKQLAEIYGEKRRSERFLFQIVAF